MQKMAVTNKNGLRSVDEIREMGVKVDEKIAPSAYLVSVFLDLDTPVLTQSGKLHAIRHEHD